MKINVTKIPLAAIAVLVICLGGCAPSETPSVSLQDETPSVSLQDETPSVSSKGRKPRRAWIARMDRNWTALCGKTFEATLAAKGDSEGNLTLTYAFSEDARELELESGAIYTICDGVSVASSEPLKTRFGEKFDPDVPLWYKIDTIHNITLDPEGDILWFNLQAHRDTMVVLEPEGVSPDMTFRENLYFEGNFIGVSEFIDLDKQNPYASVDVDSFYYAHLSELTPKNGADLP